MSQMVQVRLLIYRSSCCESLGGDYVQCMLKYLLCKAWKQLLMCTCVLTYVWDNVTVII